jgi:hypothetical protein
MDNRGAAFDLHYGGEVSVENSIIRGNAAFYQTNSAAPPAITYSCTQSAYAGTGNIYSDPLFVAPGTWHDNSTPADLTDDYYVLGNYRLQAGTSPCIDAGNNEAVILDPLVTDLGGGVRLVDDVLKTDTGLGAPPIVDMGAYETQ